MYIWFLIPINLLYFRCLTDYYSLTRTQKVCAPFLACLLLSSWVSVVAVLYMAVTVRSDPRRQGQTIMSLPIPNGRNFISISAVGDFVKTLAGNAQELQVGREIQFDAVLEALRDGYSLSEIRQEVINQLERQIITQVIIATQGNKAAAARLLHVDYKTLYRKIHKYVAEPLE